MLKHQHPGQVGNNNCHPVPIKSRCHEGYTGAQAPSTGDRLEDRTPRPSHSAWLATCVARGRCCDPPVFTVWRDTVATGKGQHRRHERRYCCQLITKSATPPTMTACLWLPAVAPSLPSSSLVETQCPRLTVLAHLHPCPRALTLLVVMPLVLSLSLPSHKQAIGLLPLAMTALGIPGATVFTDIAKAFDSP